VGLILSLLDMSVRFLRGAARPGEDERDRAEREEDEAPRGANPPDEPRR
jgi:hypothetical protein